MSRGPGDDEYLESDYFQSLTQGNNNNVIITLGNKVNNYGRRHHIYRV